METGGKRLIAPEAFGHSSDRFSLVGFWNDYFWALIFLRDQDKQPVQLFLCTPHSRARRLGRLGKHVSSADFQQPQLAYYEGGGAHHHHHSDSLCIPVPAAVLHQGSDHRLAQRLSDGGRLTAQQVPSRWVGGCYRGCIATRMLKKATTRLKSLQELHEGLSARAPTRRSPGNARTAESKQQRRGPALSHRGDCRQEPWPKRPIRGCTVATRPTGPRLGGRTSC